MTISESYLAGKGPHGCSPALLLALSTNSCAALGESLQQGRSYPLGLASALAAIPFAAAHVPARSSGVHDDATYPGASKLALAECINAYLNLCDLLAPATRTHPDPYVFSFIVRMARRTDIVAEAPHLSSRPSHVLKRRAGFFSSTKAKYVYMYRGDRVDLRLHADLHLCMPPRQSSCSAAAGYAFDSTVRVCNLWNAQPNSTTTPMPATYARQALPALQHRAPWVLVLPALALALDAAEEKCAGPSYTATATLDGAEKNVRGGWAVVWMERVRQHTNVIVDHRN
ncbi:hypothetical protein C8R45DRAFT_1088835 [Mycena sanguinolenta]|nr:hypothetical protein C8R45DRAFT_1088835 [Mycena sanguinolenta]